MNYENQKCPICQKEFLENDDIAVCPICGAPHHRECYLQNKDCFYKDKHSSGYTWQPEKSKQEQQKEELNRLVDGYSSLKCPKCGFQNEKGQTVCSVCGAPVTQEHDPEPQNSEARYSFISPFAGENPESCINGEKIGDIAVYLRVNSNYFIPKFKSYSQNKTAISFNFAAFFLRSFYFFYRKMFLFGFISLLITMIGMLPSFFVAVDFFEANPSGSINQIANFIAQNESYLEISSIIRILNMVFGVAVGLFANKLYMYFVFNKIKKARIIANGDKKRYYKLLSLTGGVDIKAVLFVIFIYFILVNIITDLVALL